MLIRPCPHVFQVQRCVLNGNDIRYVFDVAPSSPAELLDNDVLGSWQPDFSVQFQDFETNASVEDDAMMRVLAEPKEIELKTVWEKRDYVAHGTGQRFEEHLSVEFEAVIQSVGQRHQSTFPECHHKVGIFGGASDP